MCVLEGRVPALAYYYPNCLHYHKRLVHFLSESSASGEADLFANRDEGPRLDELLSRVHIRFIMNLAFAFIWHQTWELKQELELSLH